MGIPATMSLALAHSYAPYRFGAYPPTFAPQVHHPSAYDLARQAQVIRDAATWWAVPRGIQPAVSFPIMPNMVFAAPAYSYPPPQVPYQQYSVPPLGAIHNTRCATVLSPSSGSDMDASPKPSPDPQFVHVVCNAPLLAPKPLPYHSPTFLQFDLPDDDEDLSHPPYVSRPHKRKRVEEDDEDAGKDSAEEPAAMKRRVLAQPPVPHPRRRSSAASHAVPVAVSGRHMR